ncbi:MFS transporter [Chitinophaga nivalis]|uniref:MFS transporter n=1 Tax=Chitinophaga nivalis TaxID=2991709 RepID=A0ABT3IKZ8_9BACT|nr:MFS transporter [Chitinophaga nivalis]MCW3465669.1 MFS transporter [Chitinophaga nivalis]MCW3484640.1 MFS transporter [Chitinophaga nivalis]
MSHPKQIFRSWIPEWLIRLTILLVLLPTVMLFALSTANVNAATGFYGAEPADIQFSMLLYYASLAAFTPLERRFFSRIATKEYFLICLVLQVLISYWCYHTRELPVLFFCRFLQGMVNCGVTSICLTLLFGRLKSEHARETGYAVLYAMILCSASLTSLVTAPLVDNYEYNMLYKMIIYTFVPGAILLLLLMNKVHLTKKTPLYQLDWASFILYSVMLVLLGYVLIYGQQYYWLQDNRIVWSLVAAILLAGCFALRQFSRKRPLIHLQVFRYKAVLFGLLLLGCLYIIRGAFNVTTSYFSTVLGMDPIHMYELLIYNLVGIIIGVVFAARLVIKRRPLQFIWLAGFFLLLIFHSVMYFLFAAEADMSTFIVPLMIQGLGAGMLMTPIILFIISSVPEEMGQSASAVGVFIRYTFFGLSTALINFFSLFFGHTHSMRLSDRVSRADNGVGERLHTYQTALQGRGMLPVEASRAATALLDKTMQKQAFLKFAMDYYEMMAILILFIMLLIIMAPFINRTIINVKTKQPAAATF